MMVVRQAVGAQPEAGTAYGRVDTRVAVLMTMDAGSGERKRTAAQRMCQGAARPRAQPLLLDVDRRTSPRPAGVPRQRRRRSAHSGYDPAPLDRRAHVASRHGGIPFSRRPRPLLVDSYWKRVGATTFNERSSQTTSTHHDPQLRPRVIPPRAARARRPLHRTTSHRVTGGDTRPRGLTGPRVLPPNAGEPVRRFGSAYQSRYGEPRHHTRCGAGTAHWFRARFAATRSQ